MLRIPTSLSLSASFLSVRQGRSLTPVTLFQACNAFHRLTGPHLPRDSATESKTIQREEGRRNNYSAEHGEEKGTNKRTHMQTSAGDDRTGADCSCRKTSLKQRRSVYTQTCRVGTHTARLVNLRTGCFFPSPIADRTRYCS